MKEFKFKCIDLESKDCLSWEEMQSEWESEGYFDSVFRQDHWITLLYSEDRDIDGDLICQGDIVEVRGVKYVVRFGKPRTTEPEQFFMVNADDTKDYSVYVFKNTREMKIVGDAYFGVYDAK